MLNTSVLPGEIERMALETDVSYLIFDEGYRDIDFVEAIDSFNKLQLKKRIYIGDIPKNNLFSLYDLIECGKVVNRLENGKADVSDSDPDVILFTSGTFGAKGSLYISRVNNAVLRQMLLEATEKIDTCGSSYVPLLSLSGNILAAMLTGACIFQKV